MVIAGRFVDDFRTLDFPASFLADRLGRNHAFVRPAPSGKFGRCGSVQCQQGCQRNALVLHAGQKTLRIGFVIGNCFVDGQHKGTVALAFARAGLGLFVVVGFFGVVGQQIHFGGIERWYGPVADEYLATASLPSAVSCPATIRAGMGDMPVARLCMAAWSASALLASVLP